MNLCLIQVHCVSHSHYIKSYTGPIGASLQCTSHPELHLHSENNDIFSPYAISLLQHTCICACMYMCKHNLVHFPLHELFSPPTMAQTVLNHRTMAAGLSTSRAFLHDFHFLLLSGGNSGPSLFPPFSIIIDVSEAPCKNTHVTSQLENTCAHRHACSTCIQIQITHQHL